MTASSVSRQVTAEPENRSLVLFERQVDMVVWFRDDGCAAEARASSGSHDDERWFQVGYYDSDPMSWESVLKSDPDVSPVLLVRAS